MSIPWTHEFTATVLRGIPDARLATITFHAFQMHPCVQILPSEIGRRLIAEERARRAQARRAPPAERLPAAAPPVLPPSIPPAEPPAPLPVQASFFE